jgi:hypothetical protein
MPPLLRAHADSDGIPTNGIPPIVVARPSAEQRRFDEPPRVTRPRRLSDTKAARRPARRTPREHWIEIAVPPIISNEVFELAARRFEDNRRFAARRTKEPSLLQGLIACRRCGYAYFRVPREKRLHPDDPRLDGVWRK